MPSSAPAWTRAYGLVGNYMHAWSMTEEMLNAAIRTSFDLGPISGSIVTANVSVRDKIAMLRTALDMARKSNEWREQADYLLRKRLADAAVDRNIIAHTTFMPDDDETGVVFLRVLAKNRLSFVNDYWDVPKFVAKIGELERIAEHLGEIIHDMSPEWVLPLDDDEGPAPNPAPPAPDRLSVVLPPPQKNQRGDQPTPKSKRQKPQDRQE